MTVSTEINRVKYVAEDFQTYRNEANQFFQTYYPEDFNNLIATDLGNALMDQIAFAMQSLTFTINRRASELFLSSARLTSSITKLARMLGYPIQSAAPATCNLTITLPSGPYAYPVTIPIGFQFKGSGDTIYEYHGSVGYIIPPGTTVVTIPIKEGQSKRLTFISNGQTNQQFNILGLPTKQYLYSDELVVTVDGVTWTRQSLLKYESSNIYEVLFTEAPPKLRFGDGIAGNIPPISTQIVLFFRFGKGASGAIGNNQISGVINKLVINGVTIPMSFTNTVSNVGQDPEDIRHVRTYASSFFRTQNAAVVKEDYDTIAALQTGVSLADAQIIRGIDNDITIQNAFSTIRQGEVVLLSAVSGMAATGVSGQAFLGVSGTPILYVGGVSGLGVSGQSYLGISGLQYLGSDVSGNVTGISYLAVSGQSQLGVQGIGGLFVGGQNSLGVSGLSYLGVSGQSGLVSQGLSGVAIVDSGVSGLAAYLSQAFSDTANANHVQMIILAVDANNRYISANTLTLQTVQSILQNMADAVVTVIAVDGISKVVNANIKVEMGISQTAVVSDIQQKSLNALTNSVVPFGLLVKRSAGESLYVSDIEDVIRLANNTGDVRYINVTILGPAQYLDSAGNFIISKQQIIQNGTVTVTVKQRFLINGDVIVV